MRMVRSMTTEAPVKHPSLRSQLTCMSVRPHIEVCRIR